MKKSTLIVVFYLFLVFSSGILVGVFGEKLYLARSVNAGAPALPEQWRKNYLTEMRRRVKADDAQIAQINAILDRARERFQAVRDRMQPEMEAIHHDQIEQILAVLNDTQKSEYRSMVEERRRERERHGKKK